MSTDHELEPHAKIWKGFTKLIVATIAAVAVTLFLMVIFLTSHP